MLFLIKNKIKNNNNFVSEILVRSYIAEATSESYRHRQIKIKHTHKLN